MPAGQREPRPITSELYDQVRELHTQGHGRNEIARITDRSGQTISQIAKQLGLSFARAAQVTAATEVRRADLALRRQLLAEQLQTDAETLRAQMWQPGVVYSFGGKDNTYEEHDVDEPPAADKRALMSTAGMAIDRSLKLSPAVDDTGADAARSMVGQLMTGLAAIYREQEAEASSEGAGDGP